MTGAPSSRSSRRPARTRTTDIRIPASGGSEDKARRARDRDRRPGRGDRRPPRARRADPAVRTSGPHPGHPGDRPPLPRPPGRGALPRLLRRSRSHAPDPDPGPKMALGERPDGRALDHRPLDRRLDRLPERLRSGKSRRRRRLPGRRYPLGRPRLGRGRRRPAAARGDGLRPFGPQRPADRLPPPDDGGRGEISRPVPRRRGLLPRREPGPHAHLGRPVRSRRRSHGQDRDLPGRLGAPRLRPRAPEDRHREAHRLSRLLLGRGGPARAQGFRLDGRSGRVPLGPDLPGGRPAVREGAALPLRRAGQPPHVRADRPPARDLPRRPGHPRAPGLRLRGRPRPHRRGARRARRPHRQRQSHAHPLGDAGGGPRGHAPRHRETRPAGRPHRPGRQQHPARLPARQHQRHDGGGRGVGAGVSARPFLSRLWDLR
ncbi:MAG: hypothetical protein MZV63_58860 [Marinilabiliales bacterium]|nr:hypothetical protein [Marinilabiliales bacterium]